MATVPDILWDAAERFGTRVAVRAGTSQISYAELANQSRRVAGALIRVGVQQRERVLLLGHNGPDTMVGLLGSIAAGAVPVFVAPDTPAAEISHLIRALQPTCVLTTAACAAAAQDLQLPHIVLPVDDDTPVALPTLDPHETALILLTSGSTAMPKAIERSHRAMLWRPLTRHYGPGECHLWPLPARLTSEKIFPIIRSGGTMVYTSSIDPSEILRQLVTAQVTYFWAVPSILQLLLQYVRLHGKPDLPHLWGASSGAAFLDRGVHAEFEQVFGIPLHQHYALSEGDVAVQNPVGGIRHGSVGCPLPGVELQVIDADDQPLPVGEVGEIRYRSPGLMSGYAGQPELTAEVLKDGWLYTRDAGRLDADGYLYLEGRLKELINVSGQKVVPYNVEATLLQHPDVVLAAVFGVPDDLRGEAVAACVVLRPGATVNPAGLRSFLRTHLASYKVPRFIRVVDEMPLNTAGKLDKRLLKERWFR